MTLRDIYASYMGERRRNDPFWWILLSMLPRPLGIMPISYVWARWGRP